MRSLLAATIVLILGAASALAAPEPGHYLDRKALAYEYHRYYSTSRREILENAYIYAGVDDAAVRAEQIERLEHPTENIEWANARLDDGEMTTEDIAAAGILTLTDKSGTSFPPKLVQDRMRRSHGSRSVLRGMRQFYWPASHVLGNIHNIMTNELPLSKRMPQLSIDTNLAKGMIEPLSPEAVREVEALIDARIEKTPQDHISYLVQMPPGQHLLLVQINQTGSAAYLERLYSMIPAENRGTALAGFYQIFMLNAGSEELANLLARIASDLAWGEHELTSFSGNLRLALEANGEYPTVQEFMRKLSENPGKLARIRDLFPKSSGPSN